MAFELEKDKICIYVDQSDKKESQSRILDDVHRKTGQCDLIPTTVDGGSPVDIVQSVQTIQLGSKIK
jgi:hypothetical protein